MAVVFVDVDFAAAAFDAELCDVSLALAFEALVLAAVVLRVLDFLLAVVFSAGFLAAVELVFFVVRRAAVFLGLEAAAFFVPSVSSLMLILVNAKAFLSIWGAWSCASRGRVLGPRKFSANHF